MKRSSYIGMDHIPVKEVTETESNPAELAVNKEQSPEMDGFANWTVLLSQSGSIWNSF